MVQIPFLSLKRVNEIIEPEINEAVKDVIDSGWYIMGEACQKFEKNMASDLSKESGFVIGCNSGTDAICLALKVAEIKPDDEVITVANTAIPTVSAIVSVGAVPVFVEIDANTWVMDVQQVSEAITPRTKAIVPVHLYGNMVDVSALKKLLLNLGREDITIIEDCAQAQGAALQGKQAGTIGDFGAYSFYPSKNIGAMGDGGAIFTKSAIAYQQLKMYHNYGQKDRYNALVAGGVNSRLDEIQAAILDVKLKYMHNWNRYKYKLMKKYRELLQDLPIKFQAITAGCEPAWHLCVISLDKSYNRDDVQVKLLNHGLQTLIHYPNPVHLQKAFKKYCQYSLPVTESLTKTILSLPFNYVMQEEELEQVAQIIRKCL
ncbi:DegT/DnrJ/EryC1/StrS family aminotransferase [Pectinatus frisingensis]|uniref:DegT/DnrJ/EryC1/StrS family aminotransferase n=1 Tax=Pectinatus frisingensis TaxID=865 RepID=UPI0018C65B94|nr:DegT/DnrJ/EryC1/StrS family aminotransferase [Pectinatus frisingensis]